MVSLLDFKAHIRVFLGKLLDGAVKFLTAVTAQAADPEGGVFAMGDPAGLPADPLIVGHQDQAFLIEIRPRRGEAECAVFPLQQKEPQLPFQGLDLLGDGGLGDMAFSAALEKLLFRTTA